MPKRLETNIGRGFIEAGARRGVVKIACSFDADTIQKLRERAIKEQTSLAHQIRLLVKRGLKTIELD